MSKLSDLIHNVENTVGNWLINLTKDGKALLTEIEPILESDFAAAINKLLPTAKTLVADYVGSGTITNEQRNAAISQLESTATSLGISAVGSVLNATIAIAEAQATALATSAGNGSGTGPAAPAAVAAPVAAAS
jgi:hypothetical protein